MRYLTVLILILGWVLIFNIGNSHKNKNAMLTENHKLHAILVKNINNEKFNMFLVALNISHNVKEETIIGRVINLPIFTEATVINEYGNYCYMPTNIAMALFQSKDYSFKVIDVPEEKINNMIATLTHIKAYGTIKQANEYIENAYEQILKS